MAGRAVLRAADALLSRPGAAHTRGYAKKAVYKGKGKGFVKEAQKGPEVCTDPVILTTHAMGVNIYKSGADVQLKDDSQYPEWLCTTAPSAGVSGGEAPEPLAIFSEKSLSDVYQHQDYISMSKDVQQRIWLFELNLGPPKPLEERSPDTPEYWKRLRKLHMWRNNRLAKNKKF